MTKRDRERFRLAVAQALLNASRPLVLANSPLLDDPAVSRLARERYPEMALAGEFALGDLVREAGRLVRSRLGHDLRLERQRAVLDVVLAGGSVSSAAAALGVSREHLSNTAWRTVTGWVLEAFEDVSAAAKHDAAGAGTKRSRVSLLS